MIYAGFAKTQAEKIAYIERIIKAELDNAEFLLEPFDVKVMSLGSYQYRVMVQIVGRKMEEFALEYAVKVILDVMKTCDHLFYFKDWDERPMGCKDYLSFIVVSR